MVMMLYDPALAHIVVSVKAITLRFALAPDVKRITVLFGRVPFVSLIANTIIK
jgi:hypothetical protein